MPGLRKKTVMNKKLKATLITAAALVLTCIVICACLYFGIIHINHPELLKSLRELCEYTRAASVNTDCIRILVNLNFVRGRRMADMSPDCKILRAHISDCPFVAASAAGRSKTSRPG